LGRRTGIDLPSEEAGLIPSEEWVQRVYHHKWYAGETISVAIGQGSVTVTPIQLVRMIAAVATGGELVQPHLLKKFSAKSDRFPLAEDTVEQVTQGMYGVINEGGTGASLKLQNIEFSGKSGTAQLMSYDAGIRLGKKGKETNGWFVGYAPRRNPEIVVAAVIQAAASMGERRQDPSCAILSRRITTRRADKKISGTPRRTRGPKFCRPPRIVQRWRMVSRDSDQMQGGPGRRARNQSDSLKNLWNKILAR